MHKPNSLLMALLTVCSVFLYSVHDAEAITRTVTSSANSGAGTLRDAVSAAADGDVIVFDGAVSSITLSTQIEIDNSITIQGPNADLLTISGGSSTRMFYVNGASKTVTISGIKFLNGRSLATPVLNFIVGGGAIFHAQGILNIDECEFEGNIADDGNNTTTFGYGGAIMSQSELHVSNSLFYQNSLNNNAAYGGGAVYVQDNTADHDVSFNNCTFFDNSVVNGNAIADGGALYISENTGSGTDTAPLVEVINCTFYSNNSNSEGEEIHIFSNGPDVSIYLQNNIFDRDAADGNQESVTCDCAGGITFTTAGGNIYWDTPDFQISTSGTRDLVSQGINGAGLTGTLGLNGGGIRSIPIDETTSLAYENGTPSTTIATVLARDMRDFKLAGLNRDAGAFEFAGLFPFLTFSPADNSIDVNESSNLVIGFEHNVSFGTGSIEIRKVSDNSLVTSIPVISSQVTGTGTRTVTINPTATLPSGTELRVNIPSAAFKAIQDESNEAISGAAWTFTTTGASITAPSQIAWSTTASGNNAAFNTNNQAGLFNRFILQVEANANRESSDIVSQISSFDNAGNITAVTSQTVLTYELFTGFAGASVPTPGALLQPSSASTDATLRVSLKDRFARGANLTAKTTDNSLTSTVVTVTILLPKATQIGLSSTFGTLGGGKGNGIGIDGFNGGVTSLPASTTLNISLATFDDANYIVATGNSTFPIFFNTTSVTASIDNPNVTLGGTTSFTFSPIAATATGAMTIDYNGSVATTAVITFTNNGSLGSTSVTVQLAPDNRARFLAFSDQDITGVDEVNTGNLVVENNQIFNFNFGTFSNSTTLQATSASAWLMNQQRYGQVTLRVLDSPFPSNPAVKPTIVGVGGVWAAGPSVSSTKAVVLLSSTNSVQNGVFQMGWLGSSPTTVTLQLVAGSNADEGLGSLASTQVTLTINPSPPDRLAFSSTASDSNDGFNPTNVSGQANRFILQADAARSVVPTVRYAAFSPQGNLSPVTSATALRYKLFTGFGNASIVTTPISLLPVISSVSQNVEFSFRDKFARGANFSLESVNGNLSSTTVTVTLLSPPATQLGLSSTFGNTSGSQGAGIGIDGFNGGVTSLAASTTVNISISSYDAGNYIAATGNSTFPIFFFTTSVTASVDNPNVTLGGATTFNFTPLVANANGAMTIDYAGSVVTTAVITFTHNGSGDMGSTSVTVTLTPTTPELDDFTPKFGPVGTEVTITGLRLGSITEVLFDGVTSNTVTIDSQTQIRAIVPNGAASGLITISGANGSDVSDEQFGVTTSATFTVVDDAFVDSGNPLTNYGSAGALKARLLAQSKVAYLKFFVGNVTTSIVSAKLRVFQQTASSSASQLYSVSNDNQNNQPWSEGSLNFNNAPSLPGSTLGSSTASGGNAWLEYDVASIVNANGSFSFGLQNTSDSDVSFRSSEANKDRPELVVVDADGNSRVYLPTDDAWVFGTQPFNNYGNTTTLKTRTLDREMATYLKFNTGVVQSPILSSTLVLESRVAVADGGKVFSTSNDFLNTTNPWTEAGLIYDNAPAAETATRATIGATTAGGVKLLTLAGGVNAGDNSSFVITTQSEDLANYYSSESNGTAPQLLVTWLVGSTPAPKSGGSDRAQSSRGFKFNEVNVTLLPNPTDGETSVVFNTHNDGPVTISVHDVRGAVVAQMYSGFLTAGQQQIDWNVNSVSGAPLSSGVYLIHVNTVDGQGTVNLMLQR